MKQFNIKYQYEDWTKEELLKLHGVDVTFKAIDYSSNSPGVICTGKIFVDEKTEQKLFIAHNNERAIDGYSCTLMGYKYSWYILPAYFKWIKLLDTPNNRKILGLYLPKKGEQVYTSSVSSEHALAQKSKSIFLGIKGNVYECVRKDQNARYCSGQPYETFTSKYIAEIPKEEVFMEGDDVYVSNISEHHARIDKRVRIFVRMDGDEYVCVSEGSEESFLAGDAYDTDEFHYVVGIPQEDKVPKKGNIIKIPQEELEHFTADDGLYLNTQQKTESSSTEFPNNSEPTTPRPLKEALIGPDTKVSYFIDGEIYAQGEDVEFRDDDSHKWSNGRLMDVRYNNSLPYVSFCYSWAQIRKLQPKENITISVTQDQKEFIENYLAGKN